jgi:AcrR family transcriptional regulator
MSHNMNRRSPIRAVAQPKLRERLREATNEAILEAAEEVFSHEGLHAAKMETISAKAGVAVGTLYNHFKDRESLLTHLIDARHAELLGRLDHALEEGARQPFAAQLRALVSALTAHLEEHQRFLSILLEGEATRDCRTFPLAIRKPRKAMEQIYERIRTLVERGLKARALRPNDAELYPTMLMGMLRGLMMRRLYHDRGGEPAMTSRVEQIARFFLHGAEV